MSTGHSVYFYFLYFVISIFLPKLLSPVVGTELDWFCFAPTVWFLLIVLISLLPTIYISSLSSKIYLNISLLLIMSLSSVSVRTLMCNFLIGFIQLSVPFPVLIWLSLIVTCSWNGLIPFKMKILKILCHWISMLG